MDDEKQVLVCCDRCGAEIRPGRACTLVDALDYVYYYCIACWTAIEVAVDEETLLELDDA